jgi:DNA-binding NarL/FixJ family response regulator
MSDKSPIRILCVDDHPLLLDGVAALIGTEPDMKLVAEASSGAEAIKQFRATLPDITLMDLQMRGMSGVDAIGAIRAEWPWAKIIVLSTFGGDAMAQRALKAGARAYLLKGLVRGELLDTIRLVHGGAKWIQAEVAASIANHVAETALTDREIEVLGLISWRAQRVCSAGARLQRERYRCIAVERCPGKGEGAAAMTKSSVTILDGGLLRVRPAMSQTGGLKIP